MLLLLMLITTLYLNSGPQVTDSHAANFDGIAPTTFKVC